MRKSSRGNPYHDELGRFTTANGCKKRSERSAKEYEKRTKERFGNNDNKPQTPKSTVNKPQFQEKKIDGEYWHIGSKVGFSFGSTIGQNHLFAPTVSYSNSATIYQLNSEGGIKEEYSFQLANRVIHNKNYVYGNSNDFELVTRKIATHIDNVDEYESGEIIQGMHSTPFIFEKEDGFYIELKPGHQNPSSCLEWDGDGNTFVRIGKDSKVSWKADNTEDDYVMHPDFINNFPWDAYKKHRETRNA